MFASARDCAEKKLAAFSDGLYSTTMCPGRENEGEGGPTRNDAAFFSDADDLDAPSGAGSEGELINLYKSLVRADFSGTRPGAVLQTFERARGAERERLAHALSEAFNTDADLVAWIGASASLRRKAEQLALRAAPEDPSPRHNGPALAELPRFSGDEGSGFKPYPYAVIIVPGYTPLDAKVATPGVHPIGKRRLERALQAFRENLAPFVLVTGANVYPRGTPYYEAIEMKTALLAMGMPEERVIVEARARHSTTNLRNAGRIMLQHKMRSALIATMGGGAFGSDVFDQDFYFSNPLLSTFHARCERELGYRVGELSDAGPGHAELVPSPNVMTIGFRDVLDP